MRKEKKKCVQKKKLLMHHVYWRTSLIRNIYCCQLCDEVPSTSIKFIEIRQDQVHWLTNEEETSRPNTRFSRKKSFRKSKGKWDCYCLSYIGYLLPQWLLDCVIRQSINQFNQTFFHMSHDLHQAKQKSIKLELR